MKWMLYCLFVAIMTANLFEGLWSRMIICVCSIIGMSLSSGMFRMIWTPPKPKEEK